MGLQNSKGLTLQVKYLMIYSLKHCAVSFQRTLDIFEKKKIIYICEGLGDLVSVTTFSECHHEVPGKVGTCEMFTGHMTKKDINLWHSHKNSW